MNRRELPPWLLQTIGILMILFFTAFWAITGRVEPVLLGTAGTLIGIGEYARGSRKLERPEPPSPPPIAHEQQSEGGGPS